MRTLQKFLMQLGEGVGKFDSIRGLPAKAGYLAKKGTELGKAGLDTMTENKMASALGAGAGAAGLGGYQSMTDDEDERLLKRLLAERGIG